MDDDHLATSVVVVNYRTKALTLAAAQSALGEPEVREVVVVDNASGDGSAEFLRAGLPLPNVHVVGSPTNVGFGRAVNLAVPRTTCGLVLLLNSDATLVGGAVRALATALLADRSIGLVAPAVYERDGRTLQADAHGHFPAALGRPFTRSRKDDDMTRPDWVSGVAMMLRRDDFLALGGFDPDFDMYLEDVDLCRRLRGAGKAVLREPAAAVVHLGGESWGSSVDKRDHYQRSKITYFRKHGASPATLFVLRLVRAARVGAARLGARGRAGADRGA